MHRSLALLIIAIAAPLLSQARAAPPPAAPTVEAGLFSRIHQADELEMQLGRLASRRGGSALVRRYGDRLERDQDEADARLMRLALRRRMRVQERGAEPAQRAAIERLTALKGADFDRLLLAALQDEQRETLRLVTAARSLTSDRETRRVLGVLLPIYTEHSELAAYLQGGRT